MEFSKNPTGHVSWIQSLSFCMVTLLTLKLFISDGRKKITEKNFSVEPLKPYVVARFWPSKAKK